MLGLNRVEKHKKRWFFRSGFGYGFDLPESGLGGNSFAPSGFQSSVAMFDDVKEQRSFMKLANLLTSDQVILDLKAEVCVDAIDGILQHLIEKELLASEMHDEIFQALREREEQISTGIGCGVAIPHAFSESIDHVIAGFARSKEGVEFEALDHAPVNYIVLFIVPKKEYNMHLQTLAAIAKMFNNCEVRQRLGEATTTEEILDIFASRPSRTHLEQ